MPNDALASKRKAARGIPCSLNCGGALVEQEVRPDPQGWRSGNRRHLQPRRVVPASLHVRNGRIHHHSRRGIEFTVEPIAIEACVEETHHVAFARDQSHVRSVDVSESPDLLIFSEVWSSGWDRSCWTNRGCAPGQAYGQWSAYRFPTNPHLQAHPNTPVGRGTPVAGPGP